MNVWMVDERNSKDKRTSETHSNKVEPPSDHDFCPATKPEAHVGALDGVSDDESPTGVISHDMAKAPEYLFDILKKYQKCTTLIHADHAHR